MSLEPFYQAMYRDLDEKIFSYGCYFLTLCLLSQVYQMTPKRLIRNTQELLAFKALAINKKWLDGDCVVQNAEAILNELTGKNWRLVQDNLWNAHMLPANYPTKKTDIVIDCFRAIENPENTHFTLRGEDGKTVFNSLGIVWEQRYSERFFRADKRVLREVV